MRPRVKQEVVSRPAVMVRVIIQDMPCEPSADVEFLEVRPHTFRQYGIIHSLAAYSSGVLGYQVFFCCLLL